MQAHYVSFRIKDMKKNVKKELFEDGEREELLKVWLMKFVIHLYMECDICKNRK